ncbi:MAG: hypothetical protein JJE30_15500 [Desulfuromonadales bacterium]|nr:hypothetical protein [Desulfuromonadales bacterium]
MDYNLSIVLTATIIPNAIQVEHTDFQRRREEYLRAIEYYHEFATIYFLENSSYDIMADKDFFQFKNVHIRKFPISSNYHKGKGYQEFEMLDGWFNTEISLPARWIKITGRYIVVNFSDIFQDCLNNNRFSLIIEQRISPSKIAHTDLFFVESSYYRNFFLGAYQYCDDSNDKFIEHVIRERIQKLDCFRTFKAMPLISCICGSTGKLRAINFRKMLKYQINKLIFIIYKKYRFI